MTDSQLFIKYVGENYDELLLTMKKYSINKTGKFDEDIFADTIIRCFDNIEKKMFLQDNSGQGMKNFFFKAYANNIIREKQYARNAKRVETENFNGFLTKRDKSDNSTEEKLKQDLKEDFSILYILERIEKALSYEHCHLFALKHLEGLTYSQICKKSKSKGTREKILEASDYVRENITREQIDDAFKRFFEAEIEN